MGSFHRGFGRGWIRKGICNCVLNPPDWGNAQQKPQGDEIHQTGMEEVIEIGKTTHPPLAGWSENSLVSTSGSARPQACCSLALAHGVCISWYPRAASKGSQHANPKLGTSYMYFHRFFVVPSWVFQVGRSQFVVAPFRFNIASREEKKGSPCVVWLGIDGTDLDQRAPTFREGPSPRTHLSTWCVHVGCFQPRLQTGLPFISGQARRYQCLAGSSIRTHLAGCPLLSFLRPGRETE